jgi:hypothetical protein
LQLYPVREVDFSCQGFMPEKRRDLLDERRLTLFVVDIVDTSASWWSRAEYELSEGSSGTSEPIAFDYTNFEPASIILISIAHRIIYTNGKV